MHDKEARTSTHVVTGDAKCGFNCDTSFQGWLLWQVMAHLARHAQVFEADRYYWPHRRD